MTLLQAVTRVNYALRALDDDAPTSGSDEYSFWLDTFNRKIEELYEDAGRQWSFIYKATAPIEVGTVATTGTTTLTGTSTFFTDYRVGDQITVDGETVRTIATIVSDTSLTVTVAFSNTASGKTFTRNTVIASGVQTYNLNRKFLVPSDKLYVSTTTEDIDVSLVHPQENNYSTQEVHISGGDPQVVTFTQDIESTDAMVGGSLIVPGYYMPADLTADADVIPVPDPNWLVMAVASEIAFSDIVYEDRAEALNTKANALWKQMVTKNRKGTYGNPRTIPYSVKRIRDTRIA